jgi:hypothetical protein
MRVTFDALAAGSPPYVEVDEKHTLGVTLRDQVEVLVEKPGDVQIRRDLR